MARYVKITGGNGYCGCDFEDYVKFDNDTTDEVINEWAADLARDNAESYEGLFDFEEDNDEETEFYYENIYWDWEEVSEEEYNENV